VGWLTVTPDGTVYLIDQGALYEVTAGAARLVAPGLAEHLLTLPYVADRHAAMGLWTDGAGRVFVAVYGARVVKSVSVTTRRVEAFSRSSFPWSPSGGAHAPNGDTWILENAPINSVRVRVVRADGTSQTF
jgi:hypothetical protein